MTEWISTGWAMKLYVHLVNFNLLSGSSNPSFDDFSILVSPGADLYVG